MLVTSRNEVRAIVPEKIKREFDWFKVIILLHLNVLSVLGIYMLPQAQIRTILFGILVIILGTLGVTAGSHRLWAHGTYKATTGLKIFLMLCQTLVGQGTIYHWVLQHRIHHKYFGTNFDPYNTNQGFFYSHIMQFVHKPHEYETQLEAEIDMSDIEEDKVVMWQKKYYWLLYFVWFALLPMNAPAEYWGENVIVSCTILGWLRYYILLNIAWVVHSATLIWGLKSEERYPNGSALVFFVHQNYWLSYHYIAPWDYMTSEFSQYGTDCTSKFIRVCAVLGYASDMKTMDKHALKDAAFKSVDEQIPINETLLEVEKVCLEKKYYLTPLNVMM